MRTCEWRRRQAIPFRKVIGRAIPAPGFLKGERVMASTKTERSNQLLTIHPHAAGLDVGSTFHVVAVAPDRDPTPVRTFRSFSGDLHQLADWLHTVGITSIAMESTGCTGFPSLRSSRRAASMYCWCTLETSSRCPAERLTSTMPRGYNACTSTVASSEFSAPGCRRPATRLSSPSRAVGRIRGGPHSTYAEGAHADERSIAPRSDGYHGRDGHAHHPGDHRGQSCPRHTGGVS